MIQILGICIKKYSYKGTNEVNQTLLKEINNEGLIYMVPAIINDVYFLRFAVCAASTEYKHIEFAWKTIKKHADKLA